MIKSKFIPAVSLIAIPIMAFFLFAPARCYATQMGPFDVKVTAGLTEAYDDNVAYTSANEKDDFVTNARVGLSAVYEGKTDALNFNGNITHHKYADNSDYDNTSEDFTLTAQKEFSPYERASLSNSFTHAEDPSSFEDEFGRTSGRYSYNRNRFNIAFSKDFTKEFTLTGRYFNDVDTYSRSDLSDSMQHRIGFEGDYILSSRTILMAMYDYSHRKFDPGTSASINGLTAGARQYFTEHTFADAGIGYDFIHSFNKEDYTKPHFTLRLTDEFDAATRLSATYDKRYYTNSSTEDLFDYWQASLNFSRQLSQRLGFNASGFYGKGKYISYGIRDKLKGIFAGFSYDIIRNVKGAFSYSYSKTTSNDITREYEKTWSQPALR